MQGHSEEDGALSIHLACCFFSISFTLSLFRQALCLHVAQSHALRSVFFSSSTSCLSVLSCCVFLLHPYPRFFSVFLLLLLPFLFPFLFCPLSFLFFLPVVVVLVFHAVLYFLLFLFSLPCQSDFAQPFVIGHHFFVCLCVVFSLLSLCLPWIGPHLVTSPQLKTHARNWLPCIAFMMLMFCGWNVLVW